MSEGKQSLNAHSTSQTKRRRNDLISWKTKENMWVLSWNSNKPTKCHGNGIELDCDPCRKSSNGRRNIRNK